MKKTAFKFLIFLLLFVPFKTWAAQTILGVQPTQINSATIPGSEVSGEIFVVNNGDEKLNIIADSLDIISTLDGTTYGLLKENDAYSIARWIKLTNPNFEVGPKSSVKIPYKVKVPYGVRMGNYWSIIFMNLDKNGLKQEKNQITLNERIGIKNFVNVLELKKAEVVKFEKNKKLFNSANCDFLLKVKNLGSVSIKPQGKIKIEGISALTKNYNNETSFEFLNLNPGEEKEIKISLSYPPMMGKYKVFTEFENTEIENSVAYSFIIPYIWCITGLFIALFSILVFTLMLRLRRKRETKIKKVDLDIKVLKPKKKRKL